MPQLPVTCETLGKLDCGRAQAIIDAAIRDAVLDLEDRAEHDGKPRVVEIRLEMKMCENGLVDVSCEAAAKVPRRRTAPTAARLSRSNGEMKLNFGEYATEDPDQKTIHDYLPRAQYEPKERE